MNSSGKRASSLQQWERRALLIRPLRWEMTMRLTAVPHPGSGTAAQRKELRNPARLFSPSNRHRGQLTPPTTCCSPTNCLSPSTIRSHRKKHRGRSSQVERRTTVAAEPTAIYSERGSTCAMWDVPDLRRSDGIHSS